MSKSTTSGRPLTLYVGMDVHKASITLAALPEAGDVISNIKLPHDYTKVRRHLERLQKDFNARLQVCYEAGVCGFALHREVVRWGFPCEVVAPSLIPKRPGDRRKTDRRDAEQLARHHRAGQLTFCHVPDEPDEPVRDLLRCRYQLRKEILMSRHYVLKFLLRKGLRYTGGAKHWTQKHWAWLRSLRLESSMDQMVLDEYLTLLEFKLQRKEELDRKIQEMAATPRYAEGVQLLRAFRGLEIYSAMVLLLEIGDFRRFARGRHLMAFLGLVPSEHSSGDNQRQGSITKTGNAHCRHVLVQAAWSYRKTTGTTPYLKQRLAGLPAWAVASAMKAQARLSRRYWKIATRRNPKIAVVAIARELAGFIWATARRWQDERPAAQSFEAQAA